MKKKVRLHLILLGFAGLFSALVSCSGNYKPMLSSREGINFRMTSLARAKQLAKEENKPLFVFAHAAWCPTCKRMEDEVLNQKALGDICNIIIIHIKNIYQNGKIRK